MSSSTVWEVARPLFGLQHREYQSSPGFTTPPGRPPAHTVGFTDTFASAAAKVSRSSPPMGLEADVAQQFGTNHATPSCLSPWLADLLSVGAVANIHSSSALHGKAAACESTKEQLYLRHLFDNAGEAALFVHTRDPALLPHCDGAMVTPSAQNGGDMGSSGQRDAAKMRTDASSGAAMQLPRLSTAIEEVGTILREMAQFEALRSRRGAKPQGSAPSRTVSPSFVRCMLEQCFLGFYCSFDSTQWAGEGPPTLPGDFYPHNYSAQPLWLRHRLELCIQAVVAASAFSLHLHLEQWLARSPPHSGHARIIVLELFSVWWWANPDQCLVELPLTSRVLHPTNRTRATTMLHVEVVELHLMRCMNDCQSSQDKQQSLRQSGGFLSPSVMFTPSFREELRAHVGRLGHKRNYISSALFCRMLELSLSLSSCNSLCGVAENCSCPTAERSCSANRGAQLAHQLVQDWLWPIVCGLPASTFPAVEVDPDDRGPSQCHPYDEAQKDWAVLIAVVSAIAFLKEHLLPLRGAEGRRMEGRTPSRTSFSTSTGGQGRPRRGSLAYAEILQRIQEDHYSATLRRFFYLTEADCPLPRLYHRVFRLVATAFEESGVVRSSQAAQPHSLAALWHSLFHSLCDAFPNVFYGGSTVSVMWTFMALEGLCAAPSAFYSRHRHTTTGREAALAMWGLICLNCITPPTPDGRHLLRNRERYSSEALSAALLQLEQPKGAAAPRMSRYCPSTERRHRCVYLAQRLTAEEPVIPASPCESKPEMTASSPPQTERRQVMQHQMSVVAPSFVSHRVALPLRVGPYTTAAEVLSSTQSTRELCREMSSVATQIFRRYASLPVSPSMSDASLQQATLPSLYVLAKLVQCLCVVGGADCTVGGTAADASSRTSSATAAPDLLQLFQSLSSDVLPACHAMMSGYLRKRCIQYTAVSGRQGAVALLTNPSVQEELNALPSSVAWHHLLTALLWSGLPAASTPSDACAMAGRAPSTSSTAATAIEEELEGSENLLSTGACFGGGSFAWQVLAENRQLLLQPPAHCSTSHGASDGGAEVLSAEEEKEDATLPTSTSRRVLRMVLRFLWTLAISIPDDVRVTANFGPFVVSPEERNRVEGQRLSLSSVVDSEDVARKGMSPGDSEALEGVPREGQTTKDGLGSDASFVGGATDYPRAFSYDVGEEEEEDNALWGSLHGNENDLVGGFTSELEEGETEEEAMEVEDEPSSANLAQILGASATANHDAVAPLVENDIQDDVPGASCASPLADGEALPRPSLPNVSALQQALLAHHPAALHIFASLLQLIRWSSSSATEDAKDYTSCVTQHCSSTSHWYLEQRRDEGWCADLLRDYAHAIDWYAIEGRQGIALPSSSSSYSAASLTRQTQRRHPLFLLQTMESTTLVLLQSCPDVLLLALLLLHIAEARCGAPASSSPAPSLPLQLSAPANRLFSTSVECSLSQVLYHAGVTARDIHLWRTHTAPSLLASVAASPLLRLTDDPVQAHRCLLTALRESDRASSSTDAVVKRQWVMLLGSLLLSSLEMRMDSTASPASSISHQHNFYMNEFLNNTEGPKSRGDGGRAAVSTASLRVVLPSLQLASRSPSALPPQQIISVRRAWRDSASMATKQLLRKCFDEGQRGRNGGGSVQPAHFSNCHAESEVYVRSFL